jgi:alpha-galactosidase
MRENLNNINYLQINKHMRKQASWILAAIFYLNVSAQELPQLAKTPPMGWNSWDCFGMDVTDEQVRSTADYMAKKMKNAGWNYIVVDMGWYYGEGLNTSNFRMIHPPQYIDEYGRVIPSLRKFPSAVNDNGLKPLADYVHRLGLKFGIHIIRGIPWQAVEKNTPVKGTPYRAKDIATDANACTWYHGMVTVDMTKPGSQEYYNSLIEQYAEWGVDYIKADDIMRISNHQQEIEAMGKAIKNAGRPIVLSLSAGPIPVEEVDLLRRNSNLWRISGDMWDDWSFIKKTFEYCRTWQDYIMPNHWPDCDMLPLGKLRINGTDGALANSVKKKPEETVNEFARLTTDEQHSLLTLWFIFRSPLMMGGNLLELDKLTLQMLTDKEALAVNQNSINNHELRAKDDEIIWAADDPVSGAKYVAMFNISDKITRQVKVTWDELGISGEQKVRDLWKNKDIGKYQNNFDVSINPHGCGLYKIGKK